MNKVKLKKVVKPREILDVSGIAHIVWREYYASLVSQEQIEYMLEKFQSPTAIQQAIAEGYEYYIISRTGIHAGYVAIKPNEPSGKMFLSKIYLLSDYRGKGLAYNTVAQLTEICRRKHLAAIWLTVKKDNPSIERYKKMGFEIVRPIETDIGNGFIMDDYMMEKYL